MANCDKPSAIEYATTTILSAATTIPPTAFTISSAFVLLLLNSWFPFSSSEFHNSNGKPTTLQEPQKQLRPALSRMKLGCWARLVYVSVLYIFTADCSWMSSPQASDMNINWPSQKQGQILPSISLPVSDKIKLDIVVGLIRS